MPPHLSKWNEIFEGFMPGFLRLVQEWSPGSLNSEKAYQESLLTHLIACVPGAHIESEYMEAGGKVDIRFRWKGWYDTYEVFLELKYALSQKGELDRLVGQVSGLDPKKRRIIIVLCGKTQVGFLDRLREIFRDRLFEDSVFAGPLMNPWGIDERRLAIIVKP